MKSIYEFLEKNKVEYERHDHEAVFTVEESKQLSPELDGASTKNLFLRDKKGSRHFLVTVPEDKQVDLKALSGKLDSSRLSFASPERLKMHLGIEPGSVSLLALANDYDNKVEGECVELVEGECDNKVEGKCVELIKGENVLNWSQCN